MFPGGHPSKYWLSSMLLNFSDRTRTGVFSMIWPLAKEWSKTWQLILIFNPTFNFSPLDLWTALWKTVGHFQKVETLFMIQSSRLSDENGQLQLPEKNWVRLRLCSSYTEIFSKRRKIYSWLNEEPEMVYNKAKNWANQKQSSNCVETCLPYHAFLWALLSLRAWKCLRW